MPRQRIPRGTVGPANALLLGYAASDASRAEVAIPLHRISGSAGSRGLRVGAPVTVNTGRGSVDFVLTRWRGLAKVVDVDGASYKVRRWRGTKAAAEAATRQAGLEKLASLAEGRAALSRSVTNTEEGDRTTTVADLVEAALASPELSKLSAKTQQDYRYASRHILAHPIARRLPRDVDVAAVRGFLADCASEHGSGGTKHARAVLGRTMDLAVGTRSLKTSVNPVQGARNAIPATRVRVTGLDHSKAPTDAQVQGLLSALVRDPEARAMYPGVARRKARHGRVRTQVNGKDVADLTAVLFATGSRLGEVSALRWSDYDPVADTVMISGTLTTIAGHGTVRQDRAKTAGSSRLVPLSPSASAVLRRRARRFGVDLTDAPERPIFGSPQFGDRYRDQRNLSRAIAVLFSRHGVDWGRGHIGRKWRVTSLVERGIPIHKVSDLVGHVSIATTQGYLGRGRQTDWDVRAAL